MQLLHNNTHLLFCEQLQTEGKSQWTRRLLHNNAHCLSCEQLQTGRKWLWTMQLLHDNNNNDNAHLLFCEWTAADRRKITVNNDNVTPSQQHPSSIPWTAADRGKITVNNAMRLFFHKQTLIDKQPTSLLRSHHLIIIINKVFVKYKILSIFNLWSTENASTLRDPSKLPAERNY